MKRQIYERQTDRSQIWNVVFEIPTPSSEESKDAIALIHSTSVPSPPSMELPSHPELKNATIIQTQLNTPTATPPPCNVKNRKKWTQAERKKASTAKETNTKSFPKEVSFHEH